jgi:hypothetical protein
VLLAVWRRHEHPDVLATHLIRGVAEQALRCRAEELTVASSSITIIASGTVSRIERSSADSLATGSDWGGTSDSFMER